MIGRGDLPRGDTAGRVGGEGCWLVGTRAKRRFRDRSGGAVVLVFTRRVQVRVRPGEAFLSITELAEQV
jgi:hypothetical protein